MVRDNDDEQVGWLLSRREVLLLMGTASAAFLVGCSPSAAATTAPSVPGSSPPAAATAGSSATSASGPSASPAIGGGATPPPSTSLPACVVRPALTEGPYFVDEKLERSDIRSDPTTGAVREGVPLVLTFAVSQVGAGCTALAGAMVDVWHCDGLGVYSDVADPGFDTSGQKFLRGYQVTDANGLAAFTTIYPGWYQGRTVHIHFKIRSAAGGSSTNEFTSQLFFDDAVSDVVHAAAPYSQKGVRTLRNDGDGIFRQSGGLLTLVTTGDVQDGYAARFEIGVQLG